MKNSPLVSVIIPTFNRSNLLLRAVKSVLSQTYSKIEVIVIDDASTDNTENTIKKIQKIHKNILYIKHKDNKGGSAARNSGIKKSKGEYVAFLDDDDQWLPEKINKQITCLKNKDRDWGGVYCGYKIIIKNRLIEKNKVSNKEGNLTKDIFLMRSNAYGSTLLVRKEVFKKIGLFDESFKRHQDLEFIIRFFREYKLCSVPEVLVNVYGHNFPKAESVIEIKNKFFTKFKNDLNRFSAQEINHIYAVSYLEIASLFAREKNIRKTVEYLNISLKKKIINPIYYFKLLITIFFNL